MAQDQAQETFRPAFDDADTPKVSYGLPFPDAVAKHAESTFHVHRVYVLCSGSLAKNTDALTRLRAALGEKLVGTRIGMKSHTLWSEVLEVTRDARNADAQLLVTLGAGSLTDASKVVSLALANNVHDVDGLAGISSAGNTPDVKASQVPIISVPTSLSAGEFSNFAGATDDRAHRKVAFSGPIKGPALVILDAELSTTTPDSIWLSTGIRSVDHCVETLCALGSNPASDAKAEKGLRRLLPGLLRCKHDRHDVQARHDCQLGTIDAMAAVSGGKVELGASHGIGHQLGPLGVGHGETSCILLPAVCKYNAKKGANNARQENVRRILASEPEVVEVLTKRAVDIPTADLGDMLDAVIRDLGLPRSLAEFGIGREKLDLLAENSLHDQWCVTNPVPLKKKEQVLEILEKVLG